MAYYIKVTQEVADALGVTTIRNRTADGCVLCWQADLDRIPGATIADRAQAVGGALLSARQAKAETDGTVETPASVFTPERYKGSVDEDTSEQVDKEPCPLVPET